MLDARYLRDNLDVVRERMGARAGSWDFDRFVALDDERRHLIAEVETRQSERNTLSRQIGAMMKAGERSQVEAAKARVREINAEIEALEADLALVDGTLREMLMTIPNIPHESVPVGEDEHNNVEVCRVAHRRV